MNTEVWVGSPVINEKTIFKTVSEPCTYLDDINYHVQYILSEDVFTSWRLKAAKFPPPKKKGTLTKRKKKETK